MNQDEAFMDKLPSYFLLLILYGSCVSQFHQSCLNERSKLRQVFITLGLPTLLFLPMVLLVHFN